jgi:hypothetical protein
VDNLPKRFPAVQMDSGFDLYTEHAACSLGLEQNLVAWFKRLIHRLESM